MRMVGDGAEQHADSPMRVVIRISRFLPKPERPRRHSNPFAKDDATQEPAFPRRRRQRGKQWVQDYPMRVHPQDTILNCLLSIKRDSDPTLAFRYSCGHGMCGSDAVSINGTPTLLCTATVGEWAKTPVPLSRGNEFRHTGVTTGSVDASIPVTTSDAGPASPAGADESLAAPGNDDGGDAGPDRIIELAPLPGFPVQRDLIADIDPMLEQIKRMKPYLQAKGLLATKADGAVDVFEYLQRPEQLHRYELLSNCIACGVCEGSCPVYAGGEAFIGPAALIMSSRFINDSRDGATDQRLDDIRQADGIAACQSVRACSRHCPKGIDVGEEMWRLVERSGGAQG